MEMISSRIGSAKVGSANPVGVALFGWAASGCAASGWAARVGIASVASGAGFGHCGCCAGARRSVRISCSNFSILAL